MMHHDDIRSYQSHYRSLLRYEHMEAPDFPDGFEWIEGIEVEEPVEMELEPEPNQPQVRRGSANESKPGL